MPPNLRILNPQYPVWVSPAQPQEVRKCRTPVNDVKREYLRFRASKTESNQNITNREKICKHFLASRRAS